MAAPERQSPGLDRKPPQPGRSFGEQISSLVYWILGAAALVWLLFFYLPGLFSRVQPSVPFGFIRIPGGWLWVVGGALVLVGLILAYSVALTSVSNRRTGRRRAPWPLFAQGVTHLFIWTVLILALYPVVQIIAASFDPNNSLYRLAAPQSDNLLVRSRVLPDFSQVSLENYAKLFDGVVIYAYQWVLLALALLSLLGLLGLAAYRRTVGDTQEGSPLAATQSRVLAVFTVSTFALIFFLSPAQFTSPNTEAKFILWIRNTLLVSGVTGFLAVALTATAGYAFARFNFSGRYTMLLVFIFIQMFPGFLGLVAIYALMSNLNLLGTYTGLVLAYSGGIISFGTWVYKGFLESISKSLEEAALIDGASKWQAFIKILLPLSAPMFVFIFLLQFVGTYSEFILANLLLTGTQSWTVGMGLRNFTTAQFQTKWGLFAAASVLGSIPILAIFYGFQRYFVSGYTAGGVKE